MAPEWAWQPRLWITFSRSHDISLFLLFFFFQFICAIFLKVLGWVRGRWGECRSMRKKNEFFDLKTRLYHEESWKIWEEVNSFRSHDVNETMYEHYKDDSRYYKEVWTPKKPWSGKYFGELLKIGFINPFVHICLQKWQKNVKGRKTIVSMRCQEWVQTARECLKGPVTHVSF